jgi:hypothetical protein
MLALYEIMKIILFTLLVIFSMFSNATEISIEYRGVLLKYAEVSLKEFDLVAGQSLSKSVSIANATITTGKDEIGRTFYVVLYPNENGSVYVALELTKDGFLEIHARGGSMVSPKDFANNFNKYIATVVHYPGAT